MMSMSVKCQVCIQWGIAVFHWQKLFSQLSRDGVIKDTGQWLPLKHISLMSAMSNINVSDLSVNATGANSKDVLSGRCFIGEQQKSDHHYACHSRK